MMGDRHALHEEQLHALLGDLDRAIERDVRDILEQQALGHSVAGTDDEGLTLFADEGARASDVNDGAVVPSGEDAPDRVELARGRLGLERVVLVGEADPMQRAADALGARLERIGGDRRAADAHGLGDDGPQKTLELVAPGDDGMDAVAAVEQPPLAAGQPGVAQGGHVEPELGDVRRPGAVRELEVLPVMVVGGGRRAALGLDRDDLVAAELDHIEAAMDAPGRGAPLHAAWDQGIPRRDVAGRLLEVVGGGGAGLASNLAAPGGALVLAAALDGLG